MDSNLWSNEKTFVVGWYGKPGHTGTMTHVVEQGGRVLCGYKPGFGMQFQWCAFVSEHALRHVECPRCRSRAINIAKKAKRSGEKK